MLLLYCVKGSRRSALIHVVSLCVAVRWSLLRGEILSHCVTGDSLAVESMLNGKAHSRINARASAFWFWPRKAR